MSVHAFDEGGGFTISCEYDGWYVDISIQPNLTVAGYIKGPDGEKFIEEGTLIEDVDPDLWSAVRDMVNEPRP